MQNSKNPIAPKIVSFGLMLIRLVEADRSKITSSDGNRSLSPITQVMPIMPPFGLVAEYGLSNLKFAPLQRAFLQNPAPGVRGTVRYKENGKSIVERATIKEVLKNKNGTTDGFEVVFDNNTTATIGKGQWQSLYLKEVEKAFSGKPGWYLASFTVNALSFAKEDIANAIERYKFNFEPVHFFCNDFDQALPEAKKIAKLMQQLFATTRIRPGDEFEVQIEGIRNFVPVTCVEVNPEQQTLSYELKGEVYTVLAKESQMIRYRPLHTVSRDEAGKLSINQLSIYERRVLEANEINSDTVDFKKLQALMNEVALSSPQFDIETFIGFGE